jgi:hypothetical protein
VHRPNALGTHDNGKPLPRSGAPTIADLRCRQDPRGCGGHDRPIPGRSPFHQTELSAATACSACSPCGTTDWRAWHLWIGARRWAGSVSGPAPCWRGTRGGCQAGANLPRRSTCRRPGCGKSFTVRSVEELAPGDRAVAVLAPPPLTGEPARTRVTLSAAFLAPATRQYRVRTRFD